MVGGTGKSANSAREAAQVNGSVAQQAEHHGISCIQDIQNERGSDDALKRKVPEEFESRRRGGGVGIC